MATTLPGSPPGFNKENIGGTVRSICSYLRTLHDNVDFQLGQFKKTQEAQAKTISVLEQKVAKLESSLQTAQQDIGTLKTNYDKLAARVTVLEQKN
jgi:septal ring factor EnvC (AmiA/AmiB activator)